MAKMKNVSISQVEKVMKDMRVGDVTFDWRGVEITVKTQISFTDLMALVQSVSRSCFAADNGEYIPQVKELALRAGVVESYSNVRLPDNLDRKYEILMATDLYESVLEHINPKQAEQLLASVDEKVSAMADANIAQMQHRIDEQVKAMNDLFTQMQEIFSGVSADDLQTLTKALAQHGALDEEKMMNAYLDRVHAGSEEVQPQIAVVKSDEPER